jgi:hypothetical protein
MSKVPQYAIKYVKVCSRFIEINLKGVQISLHKTITCTKKPRKEQKWKLTYNIIGLPLGMLKTLVKTWFASWFYLFQETLEFQYAIYICCGQQ